MGLNVRCLFLYDSSLLLPSLKDSFNEAVAHVSSVDFSTSRTDDTVRSMLVEILTLAMSLSIHFSVFETTIRYLGGMLSAYELSNQQYPVLLEKSQRLGDKLINAWTGVCNI